MFCRYWWNRHKQHHVKVQKGTSSDWKWCWNLGYKEGCHAMNWCTIGSFKELNSWQVLQLKHLSSQELSSNWNKLRLHWSTHARMDEWLKEEQCLKNCFFLGISSILSFGNSSCVKRGQKMRLVERRVWPVVGLN